MPGYACRFAPLLAVAALVAAGCSSNQTPTVPNPFTTADRVPPPMMRAAPAGAAPAYYPQGGNTAPAFNAAPAYNGAPGAAPPATFAPTTPAAPSPGTAAPYYGASTQRSSTPGDAISVPTDSGSLRFATPEESYLARQETSPVSRSVTQQQMLASNATTQRRVATASGWISGSAPVRPSESPRVQIPGSGFDREPVSLAAIDRTQGVPIAPLEPAPTGAQPGEPAPLRVATPSTGTGWR